MQPDFITAATQAASALLKYSISATPIYPQRILHASPLATLISFADLADLANVSQNTLLSAIHSENDLAMSSVRHFPDGSVHYLFAYLR